MKKNIITTLIVVIANLSTSYSQEMNPPDADIRTIPSSPTASSLFRATYPEINLYSGSPNTKIPLFSISDGKVSTQIVLKYVGSQGIKVQDIAGIAGLGWDLDIGDKVNRTMRGSSDEHRGKQGLGYSGLATGDKYTTEYSDALAITDQYSLTQIQDSYNLSQKLGFAIHSAAGFWEGMPDIFSSKVSGRIIVGQNRRPLLLDMSATKVHHESGIHAPDSSWFFVDKDGARFLFGKDWGSREHSSFDYWNIDKINTSNPFSWHNYISTWFINEISFPEHRNKISFEYEKGPSYKYMLYKRIKYGFLYPPLAPIRENQEIRISDPVYFKKISTSAGESLVFIYQDRVDLPGARHIKEIVMYNANGNLVKRVVFNMGYFDNPSNAQDRYRLKLLSIDQYGSDGSKINLASFSYNEETKLPERNSVKFDHLGYYNSNTSNSSFVSDGAIKLPDLSKAKAYTLNKITWPTGGTTEFIYESNKYFKDGFSQDACGMRIAKINQWDGTNIQTKKYEYLLANGNSSGLCHVDTISYSTNYYESFNNYFGHSIAGTNSFEYDLPISSLLDASGLMTGYSRVMEIEEGNGKTEYLFQDYNTYPDSVRIYSTSAVGANYSIRRGIQKPSYIHPAGISNFSHRGLLKEKTWYNDFSVPLRRETNTYKIKKYEKILGVKSTLVCNDMVHQIRYYEGSIHSERPQIVNKTRNELITFYGTGIQDTVVKLYDYSGFLLKKESSIKSNKDTLTTEYNYSNELYGNGVTYNMALWNIVTPLEIIHSIIQGPTKKVIGAKIFLFENMQLRDTSTTFPLLNKVLELNVTNPISNYIKLNYTGTTTSYDSRMVVQSENVRYNIKGFPLEKLQNNIRKESYIYGYNQAYLTMKATNAEMEDLGYASFEDLDFGSWFSPFSFYGLTSADYFSGKKSLNLGLLNYGLTKSNLKSGKNYIVSYWSKSPIPMTVSGTSGIPVMKMTIGAWSYYEHLIKNSTSVTISGNSLIDELKVFPENASVMTFIHTPSIGLIGSTDEKGISSYYEYDNFQRIKTVKDQKGNIVSSHDYHYKP